MGPTIKEKHFGASFESSFHADHMHNGMIYRVVLTTRTKTLVVFARFLTGCFLFYETLCIYSAEWIHKIKASDIMYPDYRDKPKLFLNVL